MRIVIHVCESTSGSEKPFVGSKSRLQRPSSGNSFLELLRSSFMRTFQRLIQSEKRQGLEVSCCRCYLAPNTHTHTHKTNATSQRNLPSPSLSSPTNLTTTNTAKSRRFKTSVSLDATMFDAPSKKWRLAEGTNR